MALVDLQIDGPAVPLTVMVGEAHLVTTDGAPRRTR